MQSEVGGSGDPVSILKKTIMPPGQEMKRLFFFFYNDVQYELGDG